MFIKIVAHREGSGKKADRKKICIEYFCWKIFSSKMIFQLEYSEVDKRQKLVQGVSE